MPVIETDYTARDARWKPLVTDLAAELRAPRPAGQPVVEIKQMNRGGLRHVHVIWDRWEGCPPEVRAAVIRDAFTAVRGEDYEKSIAITVAATVAEAQDAGLLPFAVTPFRWDRLDAAAREKIRQALLHEGASPHGSGAPILAFATREQSGDAVSRLAAAAPEGEWGVVVTSPDPG